MANQSFDHVYRNKKRLNQIAINIWSFASTDASTESAWLTFERLKQVSISATSMQQTLSMFSVLKDSFQTFVTKTDFLLQIHDKNQDLLILVMQSEGSRSLEKIDAWCFLYRPVSLVLDAARSAINDAIKQLSVFESGVASIDYHRSSALALSFIPKIVAVNETMFQLSTIIPQLDHINQHLAIALFDSQVFLKKENEENGHFCFPFLVCLKGKSII